MKRIFALSLTALILLTACGKVKGGNNFMDMKRMAQECERISDNILYEAVTELPETGDSNTIYMILQDETVICSDPLHYNVYKMWHFYPEGDWGDWGSIEVIKDSDDFNSACEYAMESFYDAMSEIF